MTSKLAILLLLAGTVAAVAQTSAEPSPVLAQPASQAPPTLQLGIDRLNAALSAAAPDKDPGVGRAAKRFLDTNVDLELLADRTFGDYCRDLRDDYEDSRNEKQLTILVEICSNRLRTAFSRRLERDFVARTKDLGIRRVSVRDLQVADDSGKLYVSVESQTGSESLTVLLRRRDRAWVIVEIDSDGRQLSEHYRDLVDDVLDEEYSLPVLLARLNEQDFIVLEDFSSTPPGQLPHDWGHMRDKDKHKPKPYKVERANGYQYLAAQDTGRSVIVGKFVHWNPRKYPIMTWCWRVNALPPGADERINHLNDSAAGIYVMFSQNWLGVPKQIKYVWSSTLAEGTVDRRPKIFRPWFFVLESGDTNLGKWTFEQVDLLRDYRRVFNRGKPKKRSIGVGILTDANNTDSYAEAYYADFRVWSRDALERGRVVDYCDCFDAAVEETDSTGNLSQIDADLTENVQ